MSNSNPDHWNRLEKWELIEILKKQAMTIRHQSQEIGKLRARVTVCEETIITLEKSND